MNLILMIFGVPMSKENKEMTFFIVFLIFIVIIGLLIKITVFNPTITPHEGNVASLVVQFKDGTTKAEAESILENYNLTMYYVDYDYYTMPDQHYIMVDEDEIMDVRGEFGKGKNWTGLTPDVKKGNNYIISVSEQAINDENFIAILKKHNLQVKKFVYCHIRFGEHPLSGISEEHANELKSELEMNENIFTVYIESFE